MTWSFHYSLVTFPQLFGEEQPQGRGQGREPDVHMHHGTQGRGERPQRNGQGTAGQLDEPGGRGSGDRRTISWVHGGPDHVRDTVQHGSSGIAVLEDRGPAHRLGLRGVLDEDHDQNGLPGAGEARLRRRYRLLRQSLALGRHARRWSGGTPPLAVRSGQNYHPAQVSISIVVMYLKRKA